MIFNNLKENIFQQHGGKSLSYQSQYCNLLFFQIKRRHYLLLLLFVSFRNSIIKTKSLLTTWKPGSIKWSEYWFEVCNVTFYWNLFQLIVILNPGFNCYNSFKLSWFNKFVTHCCSFSLRNNRICRKKMIRLISQLIKGISRVL